MTDIINDDQLPPVHALLKEASNPKRRISLELANSFIKHELYVPLDEAILARYPELGDSIGVLPSCGTVCILLTHQGYSFIGFSSCISPMNYNFEQGKEIAKKKAMDQLFAALAFSMVHLEEV